MTLLQILYEQITVHKCTYCQKVKTWPRPGWKSLLSHDSVSKSSFPEKWNWSIEEELRACSPTLSKLPEQFGHSRRILEAWALVASDRILWCHSPNERADPWMVRWKVSHPQEYCESSTCHYLHMPKTVIPRKPSFLSHEIDWVQFSFGKKIVRMRIYKVEYFLCLFFSFSL